MLVDRDRKVILKDSIGAIRSAKEEDFDKIF